MRETILYTVGLEMISYMPDQEAILYTEETAMIS